MLTADVVSLYTIMPHELGISAVSYYLDKDSLLGSIQKTFIMDLLKYAVTHTTISCLGEDSSSKTGMLQWWPSMPPSVINLFMARWEEDVIYAQFRTQLVLWARYIDVILLLWMGDSTSLTEFMNTLIQNNRGIKLSYEMSQEEIHFLDLTIKVDRGRLITS